MENKIWEKVSAFLMDLRCADMQRKSKVHLESCIEEKKKLEILQEEYTKIKQNLPDKEKLTLQEYVNQLKQVAFEEQQETYCQGIIDTIQILSGMGLLSINEDIQKLIEKMQ